MEGGCSIEHLREIGRMEHIGVNSYGTPTSGGESNWRLVGYSQRREHLCNRLRHVCKEIR